MTVAPPEPPGGGSRILRGLPVLLLFALVILVYAPCLGSPFVQDEYGWIHSLGTHSAREFVARIFHPPERIFYRPFSALYHMAIYHLGGGAAWVWRAAAIGWIAAIAWLVIRLVHVWTRDRVAAWLTALLLVGATSLFMDPVYWMGGVNEFGSLACAIICLLLFESRRHAAAAGFMLSALLFKEAAAYLPLLVGVLFLARREDRRRWWTFWPYAVAALVYLFLKAHGASAVELGEKHPYVVRLTGRHIGSAIQDYAVWLLNTITLHRAQFYLPGGLAVAVCVVLLAASRSLRFALWFLLSLLPFVFFPNHVYRYYLLAGLVPFLAAIVTVLRRARAPVWAIGLLVAANVAAGGVYFHRRSSEGLFQKYGEGTNELIRKAELVKRTRAAVLKAVPNPRPGDLFVFSGVETWAFWRARGLGVWYGMDDLRVCSLEEIKTDAAGPYVQPPQWAREASETKEAIQEPIYRFDPARAHFFTFESGEVVHRADVWRTYWRAYRRFQRADI